MDNEEEDYILNQVAFGEAINAAQEAHIAGLDDQTQLEHGLKAYMLAIYRLDKEQRNAALELHKKRFSK